MFTCRVGPVLAGRLARVAVAEAIHGQDSEGVVNVRGQAQLGCGGGTGNLCQVGPNPWLVEQILKLDQELWRFFFFFSTEKISESTKFYGKLKPSNIFLLCVGLLFSSPGIHMSRTLLSV